jgi:hypothetical protein
MANSLYSSPIDNYSPALSETYLQPEDYEELALDLPDEQIDKMIIRSLNDDVAYWNKAPFSLADVDKDNIRYLLTGKGDDMNGLVKVRDDDEYPDNRMFVAMRAILSYATGQLTKPELTPSKNEDQYVKMAHNLEQALYEHSMNEDADVKFRSAGMNLVARKRGFLKLRYDPNAGTYGDVVTDVLNSEDVTFDRFAGFMQEPTKIYHRQRDSVEYMCDVKFHKQRDAILKAFQIKQGRFTQLAKMMSYFEVWFSYREMVKRQSMPREGVCWILPERHLILDKIKNPNWIYTGDDLQDKITNVLSAPPKPFIWFNYLNLGKSIIDETSLFDQAKPMQEALNYRLKQFNKAVSLANGRWIYDKNQISEETAQKFINRGSKTLLGVDYSRSNNPVQVLVPNNVAPALMESIQDSRNEIDGLMGTPSIFKGASPQSQGTLGRDQMVKQQASMLQDDLVRAIASGAKMYYQKLAQMFRTYYTDDYYFNVKGPDGKFDMIMLNGETMDSNVKIGFSTDSNLPIDKEAIRSNAIMMMQANRIDQLTLEQDLGNPNPDIRTERFLRSQIDAYTYMQSIEQGLDNNDAENDIMMIVAGKQPAERDAYDEAYLNYFNHFITMNRFAMLPQKHKQAIIMFLQDVTAKAQRTAQLSDSMLNDADIINRPPIFPLPKRTLNMRLVGNMDPQQTQQIAGTEGQMFTPITGAQKAQDPNQQAAQQIQQAGPPDTGL